MLNFTSGSVRIATTERAAAECVDIAFEGNIPGDVRYLIVNAAMGHRLDKVSAELKSLVPGAEVLATSCGGIIGREGAGESTSHMAVMSVSGPAEECAHAYAIETNAHNSYEKAAKVAGELKAKLPGVSVVYLLTPGMNVKCDLIIDAFNDILGKDVIVFGGLSADMYKAVVSFQSVGGEVREDMIWAVGFADKTLKAVAKANHGFVAYGEPMTVTKAENNIIYELDGLPAWQAYSQNNHEYISKSPVQVAQVLGALAAALPDDLAKEYGNAHLLCAASACDVPGAMQLNKSASVGDKYYMTMRDEDLIFSEQEKTMDFFKNKLGGGKPAAVFQTDCIARGRTLFNRIMKDELIGMMQSALTGGETPPWLGMYGFGEFCPLGGKNVFHTYTTSLLVLYR